MNVSTNNSPVGVVGIGDLGTKLITQLLNSGRNVMAFDLVVKQPQSVTLNEAVDPLTNTSPPFKSRLKIVHKVSEIIDACELVHWAVPSDKLPTLLQVREPTVVILHDSVMGNSKVAISERADTNRFVIAHCLMNEAKRVLVSPESVDYKLAMNHFRKIGLLPKSIKTKAHDTMMARTQGVFALLIEFGIGGELDARFNDGDLTPSAIELRSAVMHRESHWTQATIRSILRNPELKPFVDDIARSIASS